MRTQVRSAVEEAFHAEWGRVVAGLIRAFGDWDMAEECAQDAFARALEHWTKQGIPSNPGAWLVTTARNRALDLLRREAKGRGKLREANMGFGEEVPYELEDSGIADDRLRLIYTCCHPALSLDSQVALTLRTLVGLTTRQIAAALLVSESTMAKRLVRAKHKIAQAGIPYRVPSGAALPERTAAVLGVLYLLFNEGYSAHGGESLVQHDLCDEAVRLGRLLVVLMPDDPEAKGLLALMLLQDSRRAARADHDGDLVLLEDQDRALWDTKAIAEGGVLLEEAARLDRPGPYQLQAAIARCHSRAARAADTDWSSIVELYQELARWSDSSVVALNLAVALGMRDGPAAGLEHADRLATSRDLAGYHLLAATRADFLRRLGRLDESADAYRHALALVENEAERRFLMRRLQEVSN